MNNCALIFFYHHSKIMAVPGKETPVPYHCQNVNISNRLIYHTFLFFESLITLLEIVKLILAFCYFRSSTVSHEKF